MHHCSLEVAVATNPCAVVSCRNGDGATRSGSAADASANRGVVVAAVTANSGDLGRGLIKDRDVGLLRMRRPMLASLSHIVRLECGVGIVDQITREIAGSTSAGAVVSAVDREQRQRIGRKPCR